MPDSQTGKPEVQLGSLSGAIKNEGESPDQNEAAEERRDGNVVVFIRGSVDRADIENFFLMGVGKTLVGKGQTTHKS